MKKLPIVEFVLARIVEDENQLSDDERHWSEVPFGLVSNARLGDEIAAKRELLRGLSLVASFEWSNSYAIRDTGRKMLESMALVYADNPDYKTDWWSKSSFDTPVEEDAEVAGQAT